MLASPEFSKGTPNLADPVGPLYPTELGMNT